MFGQGLTDQIVGYLPDFIAIALLLTGGYLTIKNANSVGLLCGAWGFALCLHYRSWAWGCMEVINGTASELSETTMYILLDTMPVSVVCVIITLILCLQKNRKKVNG